MEKLNMKYDRLKEILDICDSSELDSIDLLLGYVKKYDYFKDKIEFETNK